MDKVHSQCLVYQFKPGEKNMKDLTNFIGIDISSEYFTVSLFKAIDSKLISFENFENSANGFQNLLADFQSHRIDVGNVAICMEATGVYGESLVAFLVARGYSVAVENPYKVKRAFDISPKKSDKIDSGKLAEYAYRFYDQLHFWTPKPQIIEEISIFLVQREQFTKQKISTSNALHALKRKIFQSEKAISLYETMIKNCADNIKAIDKEIEALIQKDPEYKQMTENLKTVPGVGNMLATHLLVATDGFSKHLNAKELSSYIGIVPLVYESGKSIRRRNTSSGVGPGILRKLIYLSSMTSRRYDENMKKYFLRKVSEGKSKRLVLNNIANKILKLLVALIISKKPYMENFVSINPLFFKKA